MRSMIYVLSLLFVGVGYAQETPQSSNSLEDDRDMVNNMQNEQPTLNDVKDIAEYTSDNQRYIFTRDNGDIRVSRTLPDGQEEDFGIMRRTTLDGFYVITSNGTSEVSFGSFDEDGNLHTYKYDSNTDTLVPQEFVSRDPIEKNMRKKDMKRQRKQMRRNI